MSNNQSQEEQAREWAHYYGRISLKAANDRESNVYPVIVEFLLRHKFPPYRFILSPQISFKWKPEDPTDQREEVANLGAILFTRNSCKLRFGVEAKRATTIMAEA
jgi:hypothetical protein